MGGVKLHSVLIDSGASCSIVDAETWENLKQRKIQASLKPSTRKLFAYSQDQPIAVLGIFTADISCDETKKTCNEEIIVIKGQGQALIGKETAEKLNLLRVGPPSPFVYSVTTEGKDSDIKLTFPELFNGTGRFKDYKIHLHVKDSVQPVAQLIRRLPYGLREKVDKKLDDLLAKGIIEQAPNTPTTWISPLVVVPKSNGDVRICIDMRKANEAIIRERHPIPTVEDALMDLNGSTVYSKLDIKEAFHQLELDETSRDITTFICHRGLFRYKSLFFGVSSAPEKYQKVMTDILRGLKGVINISDDLVCHGKNIQEHDQNLFALLKRLTEKGITLNPDKCSFRMPKLTFFGHSLSSDGVSPTQEKVAALRNATEPTNVSEVKSFLGLAQYSAKFIPYFSEVAEPLRMLTRQGAKFVWEKKQQEAFRKLKELLTTSTVLAYFKLDCETRIVCDAGPTSLGAVLTQLQDGNWRVITYASRSLSKIERKYSQTEKESLAVVWSVERFKLYVFGRKFEIETDCRALEFLYSCRSKPSARLERWILRLQGYDYTVVYRPGNQT